MGVGFVLFNAPVAPARAAGLATVKLHGQVPPVVSQLRAKGVLAVETNLNLAIGLPLRNREALTNLLQQVYDPSSTNYHKFLTSDQFTEQFGPTKADYATVINFARVHGLKVTGVHPNRMLLDVAGRVGDVEGAFHTTLRVYHHPTENRDFFAPDVEPSLPGGLPIQDIAGLDNLRRPHPNFQVRPDVGGSKPAAKSLPKPDALAGSGPSGTYIGDDFRQAYAPGTALDGSGQTIALVQFDGYYAGDIATYETMAGRTNVPLQNVLLDGFNGLPSGTGGDVEVALDIEMVISMAPALAHVIVYEGDPFNFFPNDVLNRIATDNSARQISCSWGWSGGPSATTDQIFQQMALQGQTFFTASGDSDAYPAGSIDNPFVTGTPSDSPYVTSVGGTTLSMNNRGGAYGSETVWNWDIRYGLGYDGVGSSGGFSSYYPIPAWQKSVNMPARGGSANFRNFPDVALTADDVFEVAGNGFEILGQGGTSCAAPLWAGFMALVNQQATNSGAGAIGFVNPALYALAATGNYATCFHDVTTGNNAWSGSPTLFPATNNYDLCTGLGTPNGTNLINALAAMPTVTHLSPPPPPYGTALSGLKGGNPNGTWQLFVLDDTALNSGMISNGWVLNLTTANPVGASADLALTMTASAGTIAVGGMVSFAITVTNNGPSVSSNVLVSDTLPLSVALVSASADMGSVSRNGTVLAWNVGTLTNNGSRLVFTVSPSGANSFANYAIANADTPDANPADDFASTNITVATSTAPQLSASVVGSNHQFQFSVTDLTQQAYVIQASTNMVNWAPIYTNPAPASSLTTFSDPNTAGYPYRFYRVQTQ